MRACDVCGYVTAASVCPVCGSGVAGKLEPDEVERKLRDVTREIVELAADPDIRRMPADLREELFLAAAGIEPDDLLRDEYQRQLDAWREKGFDVSAAERLLTDDLDAFRLRSAGLIRGQMKKKAERGRCPLCDFELPVGARECENCGARLSGRRQR